MKRLNFLFVAMFVAVAGFMTSCGNSTDPLTPPTISVTQTSTGDVTPGSTVTFDIVLGTSNGDLKTFKVKGTGSIQPATGSGVKSTSPADKWDAEKGEFVKGTASVTVTYDVVVGSDLEKGDSFDIEFKVTDEKDEFISATKTITVGGSGTAFATATTGSFNHAYGTGKGGYDLVAGTQVSLGGSVDNEDCDMFNLSTQAAAFDPSWRSGSDRSTKFVKMTAADYDGATVEDVQTAVASGYDKVSSPAQGDVYGAVLNDGTTYCIIKIDMISTTENASKTGEGYVKFSYKKGTVTVSK